MNFIVVAVLSYFFGCIQTSYILGWILLKRDIRELGTGNAGASNVTMVFGKKMGVFTALIDIMKAVIALSVVRLLFQDSMDEKVVTESLFLSGLFVILGHNYPFYMKFKGGKGTASLIGFMIGLNFWLGMVSVVVFIGVAIWSDYIVIATMCLLVVFFVQMAVFQLSLFNALVAFIVIALSVYKHIPNFGRIKNKTEPHVRKTLKK